MNWTGSLVRHRLLPCLVLIVAGCAHRDPAPGTTRPTAGIVRGTIGLNLSEAPAGPGNRTVAGDLAIVVESTTIEGKVWTRILASDGSQGWTSARLGPLEAVNVKPFATPFALLSVSPDDPDFSEKAEELLVADATTGKVLGASHSSRVSTTRRLMVPERLRLGELPWLHLQFASAAGYAPLDWVTLTWAAHSTDAGLDAAMDAAGVNGIVWRAFLGPVQQLVMDGAPVAGSTAYVLEGLNVSSPEPLPESMNGIEMVCRDGDAMIMLFSGQAGRLFRFVHNGEVVADVYMRGDGSYPVRPVLRDLNNDAKPEWILEVVGLSGDGYYSILWVVDGTSVNGGLRSALLPLSHASGEQAGAVDARWDIAVGNTIRVNSATSGDGVRQFADYRYTDHLQRLGAQP